MSQIPGTGKANKKINSAIRALTKIYVGQLVEEAKLVQIQEIKEEEIFYAQLMQDRERLIAEQRDANVPAIRVPDKELGPILPAHLVEARRRLLEKGELIAPQPQPMFLRRPRF